MKIGMFIIYNQYGTLIHKNMRIDEPNIVSSYMNTEYM